MLGYIYLGVKMTNSGKHEEDIKGRINKGRMARPISKLNNILWDRDITIKTKQTFIIQYPGSKKHNNLWIRDMAFEIGNNT
ncbi:hypothetical protein C0J52_10972 [Blattella germanica]|nr:hypothetical protein C0J52_10972 [Blattella germanica]